MGGLEARGSLVNLIGDYDVLQLSRLTIFGGCIMPKKKSSPSVDLLDLQDNFVAAVCRVKALAHAMRSVWESGVDADIADGFMWLFSDTIDLLDEVNEGVQALCDVNVPNTSVPAKVVNLS